MPRTPTPFESSTLLRTLTRHARGTLTALQAAHKEADAKTMNDTAAQLQNLSKAVAELAARQWAVEHLNASLAHPKLKPDAEATARKQLSLARSALTKKSREVEALLLSFD